MKQYKTFSATKGMMETVRIRRSGYPVRRPFEDFEFRYGVLGRQLFPNLREREKCMAIMKEHDTSTKSRDWQIGKTKVCFTHTRTHLHARTYMYTHSSMHTFPCS